ncbi:hypothetical protein [Bradyrhizobium guangzhouense]|uniref:Uncharacterized protein n=1 Tax=Bradyrhizobium guangzhouense TaxID=1325095 RepID=A0AAE5X6S6_9BRAD|nr:hypothetical protein [Bradyrhizobium guangzhouense]QAU49668.1 hypothetical protein XH91_32755 [Bradyrhizobium guangzhouense]
MSYIREKRNGPHIYLQEVEAYRDKLGRPRQRYIRTVGKIDNPNWVEPRDEAQERENRALDAAARLTAKVEAFQRETYGETAAERTAREKSEKWSQEKFLADTQCGPSPAEDTAFDAPAPPDLEGSEPAPE